MNRANGVRDKTSGHGPATPPVSLQVLLTPRGHWSLPDAAGHHPQGAKNSVLNVHASEAGERQPRCSGVWRLLEKAAATLINFGV